MTLRRGDSVPDFEVRTPAGAPVSYSAIWQHRNLLLVVMPALDSESTRAYARDVTDRFREFRSQDVECVITADPVDGISSPAVVVADRWGEVVFAAEPTDVAGLPAPDDVIDWVRYTMSKCPECEGETK
jgi:peroxiredoxin